MNLGIEGRTALVCASSQGLGLACARALAQEGVHVVINGRDAAKLDKTAAELRETARGDVTAVAADVTTADGQARLLAACPSPDILVNNNAGPSPGNFADIERDRWLATIEANMIAPLMLIRAVLPAMKERRFGRIVNITSAMVTTPRPHMTLSSGARGGLIASTRWRRPRWRARTFPMRKRGPARSSRSPRDGWAIPGNSARPAPSCAAPSRASCRGRISTSMADHTLP
jgi:3-oxoacyl-[acyl-carrier protein] reductase